jgi:hypothetical protein
LELREEMSGAICESPKSAAENQKGKASKGRWMGSLGSCWPCCPESARLKGSKMVQGAGVDGTFEVCHFTQCGKRGLKTS